MHEGPVATQPVAVQRIDELVVANARFVAGGGPDPTESNKPTHHLAVVTCMDARIDVFAVLGLHVGEALVLRNAGGRVTDDVLRSLALASHVLGVDAVVLMQHTGCGLAGVTDDELRAATGADRGFLAIEDHELALREDLDTLLGTAYLEELTMFAGFVYDVKTGELEVVDQRQR